MSKFFTFAFAITLLAGCKTVDFNQVRARAMQGQAEDIAAIQSIYLEISPSSRLTYMEDLATLNRKFPATFQAELAKQKPKTQEAIGYLINAEVVHRKLLDRIKQTHGSNNSP
jgi:hypothetical protein